MNSILEKFATIWQDVIEKDKEETRKYSTIKDRQVARNHIDELKIKWVDTWEEFLRENEEFQNLSETEQEKLLDFDICSYIF